ncbi:hypothetical protein DESA109040_12155 [Deinococcus saxicola]
MEGAKHTHTDSVCFINKLGKRQFATFTPGGMFF